MKIDGGLSSDVSQRKWHKFSIATEQVLLHFNWEKVKDNVIYKPWVEN